MAGMHRSARPSRFPLPYRLVLGLLLALVVAVSATWYLGAPRPPRPADTAGSTSTETGGSSADTGADAGADAGAPVAAATTPAATTAQPGTADPTDADRRISILAAGDVLVHPPVWEQALADGRNDRPDFAPIFAGLRPAVGGADLALCHLETPLAPPGGPYQGYPSFAAPQEVLGGIRSAGYDGCSVASNHTLDQGYDGVVRTVDAVERAGLGHSGAYRNAAEARRPTIYRIKQVPIAHLSYTESLNGLRPPPEAPWLVNRIDPERIRRDAAAARDAGAQIVIASLHWGTEYAHQPDDRQQEVARQVAALGTVDLVVGHHAHAVQPVERVNGTWIAYGLGNQLARHAEPADANRDGAMIEASFAPSGRDGRWEVAGLRALPTFVELDPRLRLIDLSRALADPALTDDQRRRYSAALDRISGHLLGRGGARAGLEIAGDGSQ